MTSPDVRFIAPKSDIFSANTDARLVRSRHLPRKIQCPLFGHQLEAEGAQPTTGLSKNGPTGLGSARHDIWATLHRQCADALAARNGVRAPVRATNDL